MLTLWCAAGFFMRSCSIFGDAKCVPCQANPPPEHAHYTTPGDPFDTDSCRWDVANPHQDTTNNSIKACDQGYELTAAPILPPGSSPPICRYLSV
jgi:hypothetical protein